MFPILTFGAKVIDETKNMFVTRMTGVLSSNVLENLHFVQNSFPLTIIGAEDFDSHMFRNIVSIFQHLHAFNVPIRGIFSKPHGGVTSEAELLLDLVTSVKFHPGRKWVESA